MAVDIKAINIPIFVVSGPPNPQPVSLEQFPADPAALRQGRAVSKPPASVLELAKAPGVSV